MQPVNVTVIEEVWVVQTGPAIRLFMQWDAAVPVIRELLLAGQHVHLELAPVLGTHHEEKTHD